MESLANLLAFIALRNGKATIRSNAFFRLSFVTLFSRICLRKIKIFDHKIKIKINSQPMN